MNEGVEANDTAAPPEASLYEKLDNQAVHCFLCAHHCRIALGEKGFCAVRENRGGVLRSLVYGRVIAAHVDPIEKKPLYHFHPRTMSYSIATVGCNFRCAWCQNCDIAQNPEFHNIRKGERTSPKQIVSAAKSLNCDSVAHTYTEPTVFFEFARDVAIEAKAEGLSNVFITNGYMTAEALNDIHPYLDAANVDLKSFRDATYRKYTKGRLKPVLNTLRRMKKLDLWVEVTTMLVPDVNDSPSELRDLASFIVKELGPETPWHVSRFYPAFQMAKRLPTPVKTLELARRIGLDAGLRHVYLGNVSGEANTHCHACGEILVRRRGGGGTEVMTEGGACRNCGAEIDGRGFS